MKCCSSCTWILIAHCNCLSQKELKFLFEMLYLGVCTMRGLYINVRHFHQRVFRFIQVEWELVSLKVGQVFILFGVSVESCINCSVPSECVDQPFHFHVSPYVSQPYFLSQIPQDLTSIKSLFLFPVCIVNIMEAVDTCADCGWLKSI